MSYRSNGIGRLSDRPVSEAGTFGVDQSPFGADISMICAKVFTLGDKK
jgi:hypothetical protein